MKLKYVLAVTCVAAALSCSVPALGAGLGGPPNGINGNAGGGNPTPESVAERLNIDCDLVELAKFDEKDGGLERSGPFESQFIIKFNTPQDGTWELIPGFDLGGYELKAWAAKGGTDWVGAVIAPGATSGTWSTSGLLVGTGNQPAMSNLRFYGCKSVPEPGSVLAGLAALGMCALGRKRIV